MFPSSVCSVRWRKKEERICNTLEELSCGISELKPKTKLDCWSSPLWGFQHTAADKHKGLPNLDVDSMTFWNSAYKDNIQIHHSQKIKISCLLMWILKVFQHIQVLGSEGAAGRGNLLNTWTMNIIKKKQGKRE